MTWWQKKPVIDLITAYEKISVREQHIILSAFVVLLLLVGYLFTIEPMLLNNAELMEKEEKLVNSNRSLSDQIMKTKNKKRQDPNEPLREQLSKIIAQSDSEQKKINLLTQALVAPKQMISLLESVLTQDKQLKLISLSNLPEEALSLEGKSLAVSANAAVDTSNITNDKTRADALIYKHTFEIELEATYDSALSYLKRLDGLPWQLFWQDLKYESTQYPKGKLNIRIYTLSMSQEVLGV
ncbi:MAG: MSHA biogenesis protein MshJ [Oleispira sp.]|jgi:MSHA biogenesis protein MshJ